MFAVHGDFSVERMGDVIIVRASGAMNDEAAKAVHNEVCKASASCPGNTWAILVDTTEFELGTPAFQLAATEAINHFIELGLRKSAHIIGHGNLKMLQISNTAPGNELYERQCFENAQQALTWLASAGYCIDDKQR